MSAGNFFGTIFVCAMSSVVWMVLGFAIDKLGAIFNKTIQLLPTFQDAANGFSMQQTIWMILLALIWILAWINYAFNESNEAGGWV